MSRTAQCCCCQARIELEGNSKIHAVRQCDDCKNKGTGSTFGISAYFDDHVEQPVSSGIATVETINQATSCHIFQKYPN